MKTFTADTRNRLASMKSKRALSLIVGLTLTAAACGSGSDSVGAADDQEQTTTSVDGNPPPQEWPATVAYTDGEGTLIGSANMNGEVVDPKRHTVDGLAIAESYPEQLQIEFTAGAEGCTAATAEAFATDTQVIVVLEVGITTDALVKSCVAAQFTHRLSIALDEGLDGRDVVVAQV